MSELAKEKLYRKELIKAGATGDNNVARIRSLAGGGGGSGKFKAELVSKNTNGVRYSNLTPIAYGNMINCFGGSKYSPSWSANDKDLISVALPNVSISIQNNMTQYASGGAIVSKGPDEVYIIGKSGGTLIFEEKNFANPDTSSVVVSFNNFIGTPINAVCVGHDIWLFSNNDLTLGLYSITYDLSNKTWLDSLSEITLSGDTIEPSENGILATVLIGDVIYVINRQGKVYLITIGNRTCKEITTLELPNSSIIERNAFAIGKDIYFKVNESANGKQHIYRFNVSSLKMTEISVDTNDVEDVENQDILFGGGASIFNVGNDIYVIGGTANTPRGVGLFKLVEK